MVGFRLYYSHFHRIANSTSELTDELCYIDQQIVVMLFMIILIYLHFGYACASAVSLELPQTLREQEVSSSVPPQNHLPPRENMEPGHGYGHGHSHGRFKTQPPTRSDSGNPSAVHPLKSIDDENLDYDSNASSSSFEFHKGERMAHRSLTRSLSRPTSYKWNDAEKWIMSKQTGQGNHSKTLGKTGGNRLTGVNMVRVVPEADHPHSRMPEMKRVDNCQPTGHMNLDRFILDHPQSNDPREVSNMNNSTHEVPGINFVSNFLL